MVLIENFKPPIWHASIAFALAILWMAHLLNPYLILVRAFLFSAGFAFGSPAHSSVIAEMVSKDDLASAYTLAGMQMDRAFVFSALASVGWSKFHLRRQRAGFPSDVSGASSMDAA
jgi:Transmembrane secretion effector